MQQRVFWLAPLAIAGLGLSGTMPSARANEIYDQLAPATVLFYDVVTDVQNAVTRQYVGSGVLIDADKRLVVTAEHVVHRAIRDGSFKTAVMFPVLTKNAKVNTNALLYRKKRQSLAISGEIVYFDRPKDFALIRLQRVPEGVKAVTLASEDGEPGDTIHVVGNSTFFDGGAFDYCRGNVRNLFYYNAPRVTVAGYPFRDYLFFTLCHDAPTNQGDSGGPIVNNNKQLLAIVSQGTTGRSDEAVQVVDKSVHVREIRRALEGIQQPGGNTLELTGSVDRPGFDSFFVPVKQGGKLNAVLKGQGTTDLDLFVKDIDNFRQAPFGTKTYQDYAAPVESTGLTDAEQGALVPNWSGVALVQVQNVGGKNGNYNEYSLVITWSDRVSTPYTFIRQLAARGSDTFRLSYEVGKGKARATVRTDGETALEIEILDPSGTSVAKGQVGAGYHDLRSLTWEPAATGAYSVRIRNAGGVRSEYVFSTD